MDPEEHPEITGMSESSRSLLYGGILGVLLSTRPPELGGGKDGKWRTSMT